MSVGVSGEQQLICRKDMQNMALEPHPQANESIGGKAGPLQTLDGGGSSGGVLIPVIP